MKYRILALLTILLAATSIFAFSRNVLILDLAGGSARFEHPDRTGEMIRPYQAWVEAIDSLNANRARYNMRDSIIYYIDYEFPTTINSDIVILSLGWRGTGAPILSASQQNMLVDLLDSTTRTPEKQTALFIEGNDFAELYCNPGGGSYAGTFADYTGALLLLADAGALSLLHAEDSSLAAGMNFNYRVTDSGPCAHMDDIIINDTLWDSHHLRYLFNASSRNPARGLQRRSYSPGAVVLLPFQFGNIPNGGGVTNSKEDLLVRMFDFAIMPLIQIESELPSETLWVDTVYNIEFTVYDNRCVKHLRFEYSSNGGASWISLNELSNPPLDTPLIEDFSIPPSTGDNCMLRLVATDSTFNFTADTIGPFVVMNSNIDDEIAKPSALYIRAFPNPFNAEVTFDIEVSAESKVEIFDLTGRKIAEIPVSSSDTYVRWRPEGLPAGVYLAGIAGTSAQAKAVYLK
jgi:hypothetical protein